MRKTLLIPLFIFTLSACRVPLKKPPIQPTGAEIPKIDWATLAEFAEASADVYLPEAELAKKYEKDSVIVRDLPGTDGRYCVFFDHKRKIQTIAMRGTSNKTNIYSDVNTIKLWDPKLRMFLHNGFKLATDDVYADLKPILNADYKIRISGHSLGGAIAVILAMDLVADGYKVDEVLTFGQPKVTNDEGGKNFMVPYFRVINAGDVVAQVPPSTIVFDWSGPFVHFGPEITLLADKQFTYSPIHNPRDLLADDLWKTIKPADIKDHQIQNYVDKIKALR